MFCGTPDTTTRKEFFYLLISNWNLRHSDGLLFMPFFLRCNFRIIFILIRYVVTITMKAFYDEAPRIAFKHCYDFQLVSINWATVFTQSVHRPGRQGLFYYSAHLAAFLSKTFGLSDTVCFDHRSGTICR